MPAFLGALFGGPLTICIKPIYDGLIKHALYPFNVGSNIRNLERDTETLTAARNYLRRQIENEVDQNGSIATDEATNWLERVEKVESDGKEIQRRYEQRCRIFGCCFPNCCSNYKISKKAVKTQLDVEWCQSNRPENLTVTLPLASVVSVPIEPVNLLPCQKLTNKEALECINDDAVGIIGIRGPGGIGKTLLLKMINNHFEELASNHSSSSGTRDTANSTSSNNGSAADPSSTDRDPPVNPFDFVIYLTASTDYSVENMQRDIMTRLNLVSGDSVTQRARRISEFLQGKHFLVLVDDLRNNLDLGAIGIPYTQGISSPFKRKLVFTTRSQDVCRAMNVRRQIKLARLQENEACQLFEEIVGKPGLFSCPAIGMLARDLVNCLDGLPFTLVTVGGKMRGRDNPNYWEYIIGYMKKSGHYNDAPKELEELFGNLQYSYDTLPDQVVKDCFLKCALWPKGWEIEIDELAKCWMGLGLVNENDIQSCYNKVHLIIGQLEDASLIQNDTGITVKVPNMIREMALWISCEYGKVKKYVVHAGEANSGGFMNAGVMQEFFMQYNRELLRQPTPLNGTLARNFPWRDAVYVSLMLNKMQQLPLVGSYNSLSNLKALFLQHNNFDEAIAATIKHCTNLTYLDVSWNNLRKIPQELCTLLKLKFLNLSYNWEIHEVPLSLGDLISLNFLYLEGTNIQAMPNSVISRMKELKILDLKFPYIPGAPSPVYWVPSVCPELAGLTNLIEVDIVVEGNSQYDLLRRCPNLPLREVTLQKLHGESAYFCLSRGLFLDDLVGNTLSDLEIVDSDMVEIKITKDEGSPDYCFEALRTLKLEYLYYLKKVVCELRPEDIFPKLSVLIITFCDNLEDISCAMYLPSLRRLDVSFCDNIRQAFIRRREEDNYTFPSLQELRFAYLANLANISSSDVKFPNLEILSFVGCLSLKRIPFKIESFPTKFRELEFDDMECWDWNELEWEEEGVKSLLEPYLHIKVMDDTELKAINEALRFIFPFFPEDSTYRGGRCPCYYRNDCKQPAPRRSLTEVPLNFSMGVATNPTSSRNFAESSSRRRRVAPRRRRRTLPSTS